MAIGVISVIPLVGKLLWLSHIPSRAKLLFGDPVWPATSSHNAKFTPTIHYPSLNWMHTMHKECGITTSECSL